MVPDGRSYKGATSSSGANGACLSNLVVVIRVIPAIAKDTHSSHVVLAGAFFPAAVSISDAHARSYAV
jgi:hypothetical protein